MQGPDFVVNGKRVARDEFVVRRGMGEGLGRNPLLYSSSILGLYYQYMSFMVAEFRAGHDSF